MKIYISVDMEGLAGITHWTDEKEEQVRFRQAMNQQVLWVLEGIQKSSCNDEISQITICDSHAGGENLSYDILSQEDDRVALISGYPRPHYMMTGLDESYDIVFLVGYHAGAGVEKGAMDHTYSGRAVHNLWINSLLMNESTINSGYAGAMGIPVGLVIGDSGLEKQLLAENSGMMPWVKFVCTKESYSRFAAMYRPKNSLRKETIEAVCAVLDSEIAALPLYRFDAPYRLELEFSSTSRADLAALVPGCERLDGRMLALSFQDYGELLDGLLAITELSARAYV